MTGPTRDEVERLVSDCTIAAKVLKSAKEFETEQSILCDAATMLQALRERLEAAETALTEARDQTWNEAVQKFSQIARNKGASATSRTIMAHRRKVTFSGENTK